jgi:hypothetical protein
MECDRPDFPEWKERLDRNLPRLTAEVERYSEIRLTRPLQVNLVTEGAHWKGARKYLRSLVAQSDYNKVQRFALTSALYLMGKGALVADVAAEYRDNGTPALYFTPERHSKIYVDLAPDWYWDYVLVHELTHHAQVHVRRWTKQDEIRWDTSPGAPMFNFVFEGHADWVAYRWLEVAHPGCDPRKMKLTRRKRKKPFDPEDDSMAPYKEGRRFFQEIYAHGGMDLVHRVWSDVKSVPTHEEIKDPELWIKRITSIDSDPQGG